jgi:hypothetical protein
MANYLHPNWQFSQKLALFLFAYVFLINLNSSQASDFHRENGLRGPYKDFLGMNLPMIGNKWPYRTGSLWIHLQASEWFLIYPDFGKRTGLPPLQVAADYSFDNHWAIGTYFGMFHGTYFDNYGNGNYKSQVNGYNGGLRLTLHFSDIFNNLFTEVINIKKWDLYATSHLGWYSYRWAVDPIYEDQQDFSSASFASVGLVLGARYHITPKTGIFIEAGKGPVGIISGGISAKLMK